MIFQWNGRFYEGSKSSVSPWPVCNPAETAGVLVCLSVGPFLNGHSSTKQKIYELFKKLGTLKTWSPLNRYIYY